MIEKERHQRIVDILRMRRFASIHDLEALLKVSEATLRRDLRKMDKAGLINRLRGGAELLKTEEDADGHNPKFREADYLDAKRRIAMRAVSMCSAGETIIIDGGSTTWQMASLLESRNLRVLTNSFPIAEHLMRYSNNTVILPAGEIKRSHWAILNPFGDDFFAHYSCSQVFMGAQGIMDGMVTNDDTTLIMSEQNMIRHARRLVLLVDSSKFKNQGSLRLCRLEQVHTVITDTGIEDDAKQMIHEAGVELIIV